MKDSKNLVIGLLCAVVCVMAVAYAAFSTTLTINGTATITSTWNVKITAIDCEAVATKGGQAVAVTKDFSDLTAQFDMTFKQPGDVGYCYVTVTNAGSLPAKVKEVVVTAKNAAGSTTLDADAIEYSVSQVTTKHTTGQTHEDDVVTVVTNDTKDTKLAANNATHVYKVLAKYNDIKNEETGDSIALDDNTKSKTLTVTFEYVQDFDAQ